MLQVIVHLQQMRRDEHVRRRPQGIPSLPPLASLESFVGPLRGGGGGRGGGPRGADAGALGPVVEARRQESRAVVFVGGRPELVDDDEGVAGGAGQGAAHLRMEEESVNGGVCLMEKAWKDSFDTSD